MTSRKVQAPHSGGSAARPAFQSPYQPPSAEEDLRGDIALLDPAAWQVVHAGGRFWRTKMPTPSALGLLSEIVESRGGAQVSAINMFLASHMHPEDLMVVLDRMTDPDDEFSGSDYQDLYRAVVTVGTARPFQPSSVSFAPLPTAGAPSAPS